MTKTEHIKLVKLGDSFREEFSELVAKYIKQMPARIEFEVISYLQDKCSIHGSNYTTYLRNKKKEEEKS
jgi:23S rRNA pseudoU1915 N3-methylase RlmH